MKKFHILALISAVTVSVLCGCGEKEDTNDPIVIIPKNEVEGTWQNLRTDLTENIKGQTVIIDSLLVEYRFDHTVFTEVMTYKGKLASNHATLIKEVRTKTASYELKSGYIMSTITKYEIDGEAVKDIAGQMRYYFYEMFGTGQMQLSEAHSSVRLSGTEGNLDNSSFYFIDSAYTSQGYYSYNHINLLFSNSNIYEYIQNTTSRSMPSWNAGSFFTCPVQIYSNYYIRLEEPPVHIPYIFINGVLHNAKPLDSPGNLYIRKS